MTYRIYWSLGLIPVQDYIIEATRSRDLKAGSTLLSWIMGNVLDSLKQASVKPTNLIIPQTYRHPESSFEDTFNNSLYNIPNRATGYWDAPITLDAAEIIMQKAGNIPRDKWNDLLKELNKVNGTLSPLWTLIKTEVNAAKNPFHLVWVLQKIEAEAWDKEVEIKALEDIETLYNAVKKSRPINPWQGYPVGKCNQCGKREAIGGTTFKKWNIFQTTLENASSSIAGYRIDMGERLCPVCYVKRLAGYLGRVDYPSTSQIAASYWLKESGLKEEIDIKLKELKLDEKPLGDRYPFIYIRTLEKEITELTAKKNLIDDDNRDNYDTLRNQLNDLMDYLRGINFNDNEFLTNKKDNPKLKKEPSNYLAAISFDGDSMGEKVRNYPDILPQLLNDFIDKISPVINSNCATPVYLGGDEGVILCPPETAFPLALKIHAIWEELIADAKSHNSLPNNDNFTLSAGIAFFDRERPLSRGLEMAAREALEHYAKNIKGKNALGIAVQTASGNEWFTMDHWENWVRFTSILDLIKDNKLSMGWAYDIEKFISSLDASLWEKGTHRNTIRLEVKRLTYRRLKQENGKKDIWENTLNGDSWWNDEPDNIEFLPAWFHLAAFLSREWCFQSNDNTPVTEDN